MRMYVLPSTWMIFPKSDILSSNHFANGVLIQRLFKALMCQNIKSLKRQTAEALKH